MFKEGIKISRITPEQAQKLVPTTLEDPNPAHYYTYTPIVENNREWDIVTYYTNKPSTLPINKTTTRPQYVYILTNEAMPGLCKIGFTRKKPSERVKQINTATGVAMDFDVKYQFPCYSAAQLEKEVHIYLQTHGFRVNKKKEFFNISVQQAISVIERIGEPYKMQVK